MRLNLNPGEEEYTLFSGVGKEAGIKITALPALSELIEDAKADPALIKFGDDMRAIMNEDGEDATPTPEMLKAKGVAGLIFAKAVAKRVITGWSGIEDPDGSPAPVSPDRIDAFLSISPIYDAFTTVYLSRWLTLASEKNGSAPSQNGTSAGVKNIAEPAQASVKSAPED